jgi:hypothetical protein
LYAFLISHYAPIFCTSCNECTQTMTDRNAQNGLWNVWCFKQLILFMPILLHFSSLRQCSRGKKSSNNSRWCGKCLREGKVHRHMGGLEIQHSQPQNQMWVVSFTPRPLFSRGKNPGTHWTRGCVDVVTKRKILPRRGSNPGRPARNKSRYWPSYLPLNGWANKD